MELDELVEHWTLLVDEQELIAGKRGSTRLGFALLLKFYVRLGRFPRGRSELPDEAVAFVAKQVGVPPGELGFYEWSGSTIGYHRWQIRAYLGFRECSVQDADTLTGWLAVQVCETERRHDQVREELLMRAAASGSSRQRRSEWIQQLFAIGVAMQTTERRSVDQPGIADRIADHLNGLHRVLRQVRSTLSDTEPEP